MKTGAPVRYDRFILPEVLSRISSLELIARGVVEGFIGGLHRSPYKGFSVEFVEYRPYTPGDDPMHVDWKLFARTDRLYVKEFEDETNTSLQLLVDVSRSMDYGSGSTTKRTYAFYLAASLAYFMHRQRDGVGLTLFDNDIVTRLPAKSSKAHLQLVLNALESAGAGGTTALGKPLHRLAEAHRKRGFVVLISDLLDDAEAILDGLRHFRYRGNEVIVFHLLDPAEVDFKFKNLLHFEDMETGERRLLESEDARETYLENLKRHQEAIREGCGGLGAEYVFVRTDQPLDFALFEYLTARRRKW